jgi:hypothetical protein
MFIYSFENKEIANEALAILEEGYPHYSFNIVDDSNIHGKAFFASMSEEPTTQRRKEIYM